jgi:drug/metabolite transporter (DMT)-like permease
VYSKDLLKRFRPVRLLVGSYLASVLFCLLLLFWLEPLRKPLQLLSSQTWIRLGVLGLFSWGLAMVLFFRVLDRLDVTQVSLSIYLLPFFGLLLSALTLGERISGSIIAGGILAFMGTGLIILEDRFAAPLDSLRFTVPLCSELASQSQLFTTHLSRVRQIPMLA